MHELACPSCNSPSQYDISDHMLMCPFCSSTFKLDLETGHKELYGDHYIVPNSADALKIKETGMEWLKRLHHRAQGAEREFFIVDLNGLSIPYWIISVEAHTLWKGLVQKRRQLGSEITIRSDYLVESGRFRRSYRWAVSGRNNFCETWGLARLHEPKEHIPVQWDGFPLDSTFSRGHLLETGNKKSAYEVREFFDFKFSNGLPILGVQIDEEEALRRAKLHLQLYHHRLAELHVDFLVDTYTELEVAGVQLVHLPFWHVKYIYRPASALKHVYKPKEKNIIIEGYDLGVLTGELAMVHNDKMIINSVVCAFAATVFLLLGLGWHPAFFLVAAFAVGIAAVGYWIGKARQSAEEDTGDAGRVSGDDATEAQATA